MKTRKETPKRGRPKKAISESRKDEIVRVALQQFAEHGFDNTSIPMIARKVGISQPAVVHYFSSKEDLFSETFQLVLTSNRNVIESLHSPYDDAPKRLYKHVMGNVLWMTSKKEEASLLLLLYYYAQLRPYFSSLYSRLLEGAVTKFTDILLAGLREKHFHFDPTHVRRYSTILHNFALGACVNRATTAHAQIYPHDNLLHELDTLCMSLLDLKQRPKAFQSNTKLFDLDYLIGS